MTTAVILVVEDEPSVRQIAVDGLADAGFSVRESGDAAEALAMLSADDEVDLLFSDIVLPGGFDGIELARRAQALRPTLSVILTSGGHGHVGSFEGVTAGFLAKPYRLDGLVAAVRTALAPS